MFATATDSPIDALLEPIPGDNPAGDPNAYAYGVREQLEDLRREDDPDDFDDATRPAQLKKADWPAVARLCEEVLTNRSKDLRVVCHWVEAQTRIRGFAGLRDGLHLLARMMDEAWDRMLPSIDDGDLEVRGAPLSNMLDDADHGLRFPNTVRQAPILGQGECVAGYLDLNRLRASKAPDDEELLRRLLNATTPSSIKQIADDLDGALEELQLLIPAMDARMGSSAPSFTQLGTAIADCQRMARQYVTQFTPAGEAPAATETATPGPTSAGETLAGGAAQANTREEAYAMLQRAAEVLAQLEPHSPIPYLIKRAVDLGRLPFPRLMQELVRDDNVLTEMNRELGIRESQT